MNTKRFYLTDFPATMIPHQGGYWRRALATTRDVTAATIDRLVQSYRHGQAIRHLESLSDHSLKDIGIDRSEIAARVRGSNLDHVRRDVPSRAAVRL